MRYMTTRHETIQARGVVFQDRRRQEAAVERTGMSSPRVLNSYRRLSRANEDLFTFHYHMYDDPAFSGKRQDNAFADSPIRSILLTAKIC